MLRLMRPAKWLVGAFALTLIACGSNPNQEPGTARSAVLTGPYNLTLNIGGLGSGTVTVSQGTDSFTCASADVICQTPVAAGDVTISGAQDPGSVYAIRAPYCAVNDCIPFDDPEFMPPDPYWWSGDYTFTVTGDTAVYARFTPQPAATPAVTLTVNVGGTGTGTIAGLVDKAPILWADGSEACAGPVCTVANSMNASSQVVLTASRDPSSGFKGFKAPYCEVIDCSAIDDPEFLPPAHAWAPSGYSFGMTGPRSIDARFESVTITLMTMGLKATTPPFTMSGAVDVPGMPASMLQGLWGDLALCAVAGACTIQVPPGHVVRFNPPEGGNTNDFVFKAWSGACTGTASGKTAPPCVVTANANVTVYAGFGPYVPPVLYRLTTALSGVLPVDAVAVLLTIGGSGQQMGGFSAGSVATITAPDLSAAGTLTSGNTYRFVRWVGCTPLTASPLSCTVTMSYSRSVTAVYVQTFPLRLTVNGGAAISPGVNIRYGTNATCPQGVSCLYAVDKGAVVTLSATAGAPAAPAYVQWTGTCGGMTSSGCSFYMSGPVTATAKFPPW